MSKLICALLLAGGIALAQVKPLTLDDPPATPPAAATATSTTNKNSVEVDVSGNQQWIDSGFDVEAGDAVMITATGSLQYQMTQAAGPEGVPRGWRDLLRITPLNDAAHGALIGRIGNTDAARPFLIGPRREMTVPRAGRLFLGLNQMSNESASGSFHVVINRTKAAPPKSSTPVVVPAIPASVLSKIPRRVVDAAGNQGDVSNFLVVGSQDRVLQTFTAAGWVQVDKTTKDAVLHGIMASISKEAYTQMPMSELMMFGRIQDYGLAHAEPFTVVAQRHHLRLWKSPYDIEGQSLWVGAATHDIGLEKDQRNGKLTHKIDPDVDTERDYVGASLSETGNVVKLDYVTPSNAMQGDLKTATGGTFRTDGRTLVIYLSSASSDSSAAFTNLFCSVLKANPDGGTWNACDSYIDGKADKEVDLAPLSDQYRVLIVPGILSSCASTAPAFQEGQTSLKEKYKMAVDLMSMPNDSSESNAKLITQFIKDQAKTDPRKFIIVGYSKGAPDVQVAFAQDPSIAQSVAAFVTVAGAVGGSPIADILPVQADKWIKLFKYGSCQGDLSSGFKSLKRDVRQAFLASYPTPPVPTYSIPAVSDKTNTSKALLENWQMMTVYGGSQDSQLVKADAMVPGAKYLGTARGDHFAVALPLEKANDGSLKSLIDHGSYPRAALLESIVRFVVQDLDAVK